MNRAFADTFYFLALLNPRDKAHAWAVAYAAALLGELITTAWVLTEPGDVLVLRGTGRSSSLSW